MPKYVLHYFEVRARGEPIRLLLTVAGQEFEDHRVSNEEWPKIKEGTLLSCHIYIYVVNIKQYIL